jgi:hypothetical protein
MAQAANRGHDGCSQGEACMHPVIRNSALAAVFAIATPDVIAQSTDGFHEIQVFPIVVDSTSFTQRFSFRTTPEGVATVSPRYFPASGTSQAVALSCPDFEIPAGGATRDGLRSICPGLAPGSQFGFLVLEQTGPSHRSFSGFSRVSNPAGAGFAVEAFAGHTFTSAFSTATGLRRKAATQDSPAYQTNCFIGLMGEHEGPATTSKVQISLLDQAGAALGGALAYDLLPGQLVRVLDVFSAVGAPAGDHDSASMVARQVLQPDVERPGIISFCTVQDNTSFGADFRVAKQEYGFLALGMELPNGQGAYDGHVGRITLAVSTLSPWGASPADYFNISPGSGQQNSHVIYFRHPDWASCELVNRQTYERMDPSMGLEMRLLALNEGDTAFEVIAGGSGITGWERIYLGDKREHMLGMNAPYVLQVEDSSGGNPGPLQYGLRCRSGSGHTRGDLIERHRAADDF